MKHPDVENCVHRKRERQSHSPQNVELDVGDEASLVFLVKLVLLRVLSIAIVRFIRKRSKYAKRTTKLVTALTIDCNFLLRK